MERRLPVVKYVYLKVCIFGDVCVEPLHRRKTIRVKFVEVCTQQRQYLRFFSHTGAVLDIEIAFILPN